MLSELTCEAIHATTGEELAHKRQSWELRSGLQRPSFWVMYGSWGEVVESLCNIIMSYNIQEYEMKTLSKVDIFHK